MRAIISCRLYFIFALFFCFPLYAIPKNIDFSPLCQLFGHPLAAPVEVLDENSHGDAVGCATFASCGTFGAVAGGIKALWYWDKETGFQILTTSLSVPGIKDDWFRFDRGQFNFDRARINNNRIVACSYSACWCVGCCCQVVSGWFWWTKKGGAHFSEFPSQCVAMIGINDKDQILFERYDGGQMIVDIHSKK
jgi:hypothetical protein